MTQKKKLKIKSELPFVPKEKAQTYVEHPEIEAIETDFQKLKAERTFTFFKYFLRNIGIMAVLLVIFFVIIYYIAKAQAGV